MLNSTVIGSPHWYYNEAFLNKLTKKRQKNCFFQEKKTRYLNLKRKSLPINDVLNVLIKTVTCSTVLELVFNHGIIMKRF